MNQEQLALRDACLRVVAAIKKVPAKAFIALERFPLGSCGTASAILGLCLADDGFGNFHYVSGKFEGRQQTHAWLEQYDLILDITASQFYGITDPAWLTTDRTWHSQFVPDAFCPCRLVTRDNFVGDLRAYFAVRKLLDAN